MVRCTDCGETVVCAPVEAFTTTSRNLAPVTGDVRSTNEEVVIRTGLKCDCTEIETTSSDYGTGRAERIDSDNWPDSWTFES